MLAKKERGTEWGARKSIDTDGNVAIVASFRSPGYRPPGTKRGLLDGMGFWDHRESDSFRGESLSCIRLSVMAIPNFLPAEYFPTLRPSRTDFLFPRYRLSIRRQFNPDSVLSEVVSLSTDKRTIYGGNYRERRRGKAYLHSGVSRHVAWKRRARFIQHVEFHRSRLVSSDFADDDDVNYTGGLYTIYPPVDKELRILAPFLPRSSFLLPTFWLARRYSHPILVLVSPRARNGACHNLSRASRIFSRIENRN